MRKIILISFLIMLMATTGCYVERVSTIEGKQYIMAENGNQYWIIIVKTCSDDTCTGKVIEVSEAEFEKLDVGDTL